MDPDQEYTSPILPKYMHQLTEELEHAAISYAQKEPDAEAADSLDTARIRLRSAIADVLSSHPSSDSRGGRKNTGSDVTNRDVQPKTAADAADEEKNQFDSRLIAALTDLGVPPQRFGDTTDILGYALAGASKRVEVLAGELGDDRLRDLAESMGAAEEAAGIVRTGVHVRDTVARASVPQPKTTTSRDAGVDPQMPACETSRSRAKECLAFLDAVDKDLGAAIEALGCGLDFLDADEWSRLSDAVCAAWRSARYARRELDPDAWEALRPSCERSPGEPAVEIDTTDNEREGAGQ